MEYSIENPYDYYNQIREYYSGKPTTGSIKDELIKIYLHNIKLGIENNYNDLIKKNVDDKIRIMSWNVRYFTDVNNNPTIDKISDVIKEISPDILCLQEATMGHSEYYPVGTKYHTDIRDYLLDYELISFCNVVPSWYCLFSSLE
jgi:hypothetical protein